MSEINKNELIEEVSKLMELDENELYAILGYQSLGLEERATELGLLDSFSITKSDLRIRGGVFFERYKQQLEKKICDEWQYCKKRTLLQYCKKGRFLTMEKPAELSSKFIFLCLLKRWGYLHSALSNCVKRHERT